MPKRLYVDAILFLDVNKVRADDVVALLDLRDLFFKAGQIVVVVHVRIKHGIATGVEDFGYDIVHGMDMVWEQLTVKDVFVARPMAIGNPGLRRAVVDFKYVELLKGLMKDRVETFFNPLLPIDAVDILVKENDGAFWLPNA